MILKSFVLVAAVAALSATTAAPSQKIFGGQYAEEHQFPYQVALFAYTAFHCGGSIIDSQWILTAAHCVLKGAGNIPPEALKVYAGSFQLYDDGHFLDVESSFAHESYGSFQNDIALIKLKKPIQFDKTMQKIELNREELPPKSAVVISGFGKVESGMNISLKLKYNTMYVVANDACYREVGFAHGGLICFNAEKGNGACNGDSGGPAVFDGKVVGVANFVMDSCGTTNPDGYAKVAYFADWIEETIKSHSV